MKDQGALSLQPTQNFFVDEAHAHALLYYKRKWTLFEMKYARKKKKKQMNQSNFNYICVEFTLILVFYKYIILSFLVFDQLDIYNAFTILTAI